MTRREMLMMMLAAAASTTASPARPRLYPIGLGSWQTFDVGPSDAQRKPLAEVLSLFVQLGGTVIDSSPMYGRSESVLGDLAVKLGIRDKLFVATKVWTDGRASGIAQMHDSERKLRGRIDLMQVHNLQDAETHLGTLRGWKREGRIRYIGITHYTASAHNELADYIRRGGIDFVQVNYSLAEREAERRLLPLAQDKGVSVLINRPFGAGTLFRETRGKALPAFAKDLGATSWAELFLKFVISHPRRHLRHPRDLQARPPPPEHERGERAHAGRGDAEEDRGDGGVTHAAPKSPVPTLCSKIPPIHSEDNQCVRPPVFSSLCSSPSPLSRRTTSPTARSPRSTPRRSAW